jgi:hypothetical protein
MILIMEITFQVIFKGIAFKPKVDRIESSVSEAD